MKKFRILGCAFPVYPMVLLAVAVASSTAWAEQISLSGVVYSDDNNSATRESNEFGIPDVLVILDGLIDPVYMEQTLQMFTWTDAYGRYSFENIPAGTYSLIEITPYEFVEGRANAPGSLGGHAVTSNQFADIMVSAGDIGVDYNFGEWGLRPGYFSKRDFIVDPVPEPSTGALVFGLVFLGTCLRRRR